MRKVGLASWNAMYGAWAGPLPRVGRLRAEDWCLLRKVRLEMLADTPMAYVESLEAARRQTDAQWQERTAAMAGDSSVRLVADGGVEGSRFCGLMRVVLKHPQDPRKPLQAMLISVYVAPEHRGLGLADELLHQACEAARMDLGAKLLELGVQEDNSRALAFYRRHGFNTTGDSRPYPQDTSKQELVMEKI